MQRKFDESPGKPAEPGTESAVELDESQLDDVAGGYYLWDYKGKFLDGKGNDVLTEEVQGMSGPRSKTDGND